MSVGEHIVKIATITGAATNSENGLIVNVSNSALTSSTGGTILFTVGDADAVGANANSSISGLVGGNLNYTISNARGLAPDSSIFIFYNVGGGVAPGTYTGSVTFTVFNR